MKLTPEEIEKYSERIHIIWARWFLHHTRNATPENMKRWIKLAKTNYNKLPEEEKQKDRNILKEILK